MSVASVSNLVPPSNRVAQPSATTLNQAGLRPFTVDEYHTLIRTGVLKEDDPVELLEGVIAFKMPRLPRHDSTVDRVHTVLQRHLGEAWRVRSQSAITTDDSEPEPDVVVVSGPVEKYDQRHPGPADIALVVEVAESSLAHDRDSKLRIYAKAGIPTYWIVNLADSVVEVHTDPTGPTGVPAYRSRGLAKPGETIPLRVPGNVIQIGVRELLP